MASNDTGVGLADINFASRLNDFLDKVFREALRARKLFPSNKHQLAAFVEEVGEVNQAFLEYDRGQDTSEHVEEECVQAAAMAARCAIEGDGDFKYVAP